MSAPIVWLDRGKAVHGEVTVRTVWELVDGAYNRVAVDALGPAGEIITHLYRRSK